MLGKRSLPFFCQSVKIPALGFQKAFADKAFDCVKNLYSLRWLISAGLEECVQIQTVAAQFLKDFQYTA